MRRVSQQIEARSHGAGLFFTNCLMSIPPRRLIHCLSENLRRGQAFQARLTAGLTDAGFVANAKVSS